MSFIVSGLLMVSSANSKALRQKIPSQSWVAGSKTSSNDSMKLNVGDDVKSASIPDRPVSAPGLDSPPDKGIGRLENLSLNQPPGRPTPSPPPNPLKRAAVMDGASSDVDPKQRDGTTRSRRAKALSGGPFLNSDSNFDRRAPFAGDPEFNRTSQAGPNRRLFDPATDSPVANMNPRGSGKYDNAGAPRRVHDPRTHIFRSKKAQQDLKEDMIPSFDSLKTPFGHRQPIYIEKAPPKASSTIAMPESLEPKKDLLSAPPSSWSPTDFPPEMILQPETRPISHEQLVVEVKGIYAGLVMVEAKCVDVDEKQSIAAQEKDPTKQTKLSNEQWQALIALHRTLLHEHHDFFLASQHPSASPALTRLAAKYSMPARMWRHAIHSFLEVMRHRLPESLDHMLAFIYIAYSMVALLYETVTAFEDTWIECLGDLGRYRMAIEDDDIRDREVWSGVSRFWYGKAADKNPHIGRLFHHLAILSRSCSLEQLSFYTRSLTCIQPFTTSRSSIMAVFKPILDEKDPTSPRASQLESVFIKTHGIQFTGRSLNEFNDLVSQLSGGLFDHYIGKIAAKFKAQGVFVAVTNIAALFEYGALKPNGSTRSIFRLAFDEFDASRKHVESSNPAHADEKHIIIDNAGHQLSVVDGFVSPSADLTPIELRDSQEAVARASCVMFATLLVALRRIGDKNIFPLVHVCLVFLWSLAIVGKPIQYVEKDVPWGEISSFLNALVKSLPIASTIEAEEFPWPAEGPGRPLPEDFVVRGQVWSRRFFPAKWFEDAMDGDEERPLELPSMTAPRVERILWLGVHLASFERWIHYDRESKTFSTPANVG